jgi:hypothetical protein
MECPTRFRATEPKSGGLRPAFVSDLPILAEKAQTNDAVDIIVKCPCLLIFFSKTSPEPQDGPAAAIAPEQTWLASERGTPALRGKLARSRRPARLREPAAVGPSLRTGFFPSFLPSLVVLSSISQRCHTILSNCC